MAKKRRNQDNRILWVLFGILAVCIIALLFLFFKLFYSGVSSTKYGDRLDNIDKYVLSNTLEENIVDLYKSEESINKVSVDVQGKIIYIIIDFKKSIKVTKAEDLAIKSLDKIGEKNLTFYEVQYILTYSGEEENENFPVFGSKNANSLKVVW